MAIAFDSSTNPVYSGTTPQTFSHTCSGSDRLLYVGILHDTVTITGVTYASVAMTQIGSSLTYNGNAKISHFYLINPATGTNSVVVTASGNNLLISGAVSYTGVHQTSALNANTSQSETDSSTTTTLTTTVDNCWTVLFTRTDGTGNTAPGTGTTERANTDGYTQFYDSNGPITPAGSTSLQTTQTSNPIGHLMAAFAPATGAAPTFIPRISFIM